jgi:hypothetical protein
MMFSTIRKAALATVAPFLLFGALAAEARADLVTNGGFETTVPASNVSGLNPAGWTVSSSGGDTFDNCGGVSRAAPAHSGLCAMTFAEVGGSGTISQTLATTPGTRYSITFWLGDFLTNGGAAENQFSASFGGSTIFSETNMSLSPYAEFTETAVATSASTVLSFAGFDVPNSIGLDDVSVNPAAVPAPEPASLPLLAVGLAGLGMVLRTRRA